MDAEPTLNVRTSLEPPSMRVGDGRRDEVCPAPSSPRAETLNEKRHVSASCGQCRPPGASAPLNRPPRPCAPTSVPAPAPALPSTRLTNH
ncbi:hypothetical protein CVT26_005303 [Gymnopilus dilepis]|uniref:Uncharacterized protein n=1 Tax=Gymnopilus dilepis TaxID=231916 RepID=A0A409YSV2_9AGAR|nr:hypothetical protein CVT26_005303 [Gymnopilus dilepis]